MTNKIYQIEESGRRWAVADPMDESLTLDGLASQGVRQGDQWDRGAAARPTRYRWRITIDGFATTPVVGESVLLYYGGSNGSEHDAGLGVADAASVVAALPNLTQFGAATVQVAVAATPITRSGFIDLYERYFTPVFYNRCNDAFKSASTPIHYFEMTAVSDQIQ